MDWPAIEQELGCKIVYASLAGSRRYGIERAGSDYDYRVNVISSDGSDCPVHGHRLISDTDYFLYDISDPSLALMAHVWTLSTYDSVVYADDKMAKFISDNKTSLLHISPFITQKECKRLVYNALNLAEQSFLENPGKSQNKYAYRKLAYSAILSGVLSNFMKTGSFDDSFHLEGDFLTLYHRAREFDPEITVDLVRELVAPVLDDKATLFFQEYPTNHEILTQYKDVVGEIRASLVAAE